jgi:hypothetical protein
LNPVAEVLAITIMCASMTAAPQALLKLTIQIIATLPETPERLHLQENILPFALCLMCICNIRDLELFSIVWECRQRRMPILPPISQTLVPAIFSS